MLQIEKAEQVSSHTKDKRRKPRSQSEIHGGLDARLHQVARAAWINLWAALAERGGC